MDKKTKQATKSDKKTNVIKEENVKEAVLGVEKDENVENTALDEENTILDVEKKDSDIIRKTLEGNTSNAINEDGQNSIVTSEEGEQPKPIEDNEEIDATTIYEKISESAKIGKGQSEEVEDNVENKDLQDKKQNSNDKVNTAKHKISKLFGYYWNGQLMD